MRNSEKARKFLIPKSKSLRKMGLNVKKIDFIDKFSFRSCFRKKIEHFCYLFFFI